jgi:hypothetical protein
VIAYFYFTYRIIFSCGGGNSARAAGFAGGNSRAASGRFSQGAPQIVDQVFTWPRFIK